MKKVISTLIFFLVALCLMGGGKKEADSGKPQGPSQEKITLNVWMAHTGSPTMNTKMQELAQQYTTKHPNITVVYEPLVGDRAYPRIMAAAQADNLPDVVESWSHWPTQFAAMGRVMELDEIFEKYKKDGTFDDFVEPQTYNKWKFKGHYYGIPWGAAPRIVYYRKDLLKNAGLSVPKTWDDLINATQKTNKDGVFGLTYPVGRSIWGQQHFWMSLFQAGGYILDKDGKSAVKTEPTRTAMKFHSDFFLKYKVMPPGIVSYEQDDSDLIFAQGKAAFAYSHGAMFDTIEKHGVVPRENVGVLPALEGPGGRVGLQFYNPVFFAKNTKHPKEAIALGEWLCSDEVIIPLAQARNGYLWPVRKSHLKHSYFMNNPNHLFKETAEGVIPFSKDITYPFSSIPEWGPIDGEGQFSVALSQVLTGQKTIDQVIDELDVYVRKIVEHK